MIIQIGTDADESRILWKRNEDDEWERADIDDLIRAYEEQPVHGEWVNEWKYIDGGRMYGSCCSICHTIGHSGYNFCPNCGAKMIAK